MISDSFFEPGFGHEVCEDYAIHGENYAIISDGCTNDGGPRIDTDWGARILCKLAEMRTHMFDPEVLMACIGTHAKVCQSMIPNLADCLTATLWMLRVLDDKFHVFGIGDGVVGGKRKDGRWKIYVVEFPHGPFYLKYKMFNEEQRFLDAFGPKYTTTTYFGNLMECHAFPDNPVFIYKDSEAVWSQLMTRTEKEYDLKLESPYNVFEFPTEEYEFAFILSDGIKSFQQPLTTLTKKWNENVHFLNVMYSLLDFVSFRPNFARIQRNWMFRQDKRGTFVRYHWKNFDDISLGIIHA